MLKTSADLPNDIEALKALVLSQQTELHAHSLIIQALRLQIARLKKQKFGASSEKIQREIAQLELALEGLEIASAENNATPSDEGDKVDPKDSDEDNSAPKSPRRRPCGARWGQGGPRAHLRLPAPCGRSALPLPWCLG